MQQHAVIDKDLVYIGMYPASADIPEGAHRLEWITECDLPRGRYLWLEDHHSADRGAFVNAANIERIKGKDAGFDALNNPMDEWEQLDGIALVEGEHE